MSTIAIEPKYGLAEQLPNDIPTYPPGFTKKATKWVVHEAITRILDEVMPKTPRKVLKLLLLCQGEATGLLNITTSGLCRKFEISRRIVEEGLTWLYRETGNFVKSLKYRLDKSSCKCRRQINIQWINLLLYFRDKIRKFLGDPNWCYYPENKDQFLQSFRIPPQRVEKQRSCSSTTILSTKRNKKSKEEDEGDEKSQSDPIGSSFDSSLRGSLAKYFQKNNESLPEEPPLTNPQPGEDNTPCTNKENTPCSVQGRSIILRDLPISPNDYVESKPGALFGLVRPTQRRNRINGSMIANRGRNLREDGLSNLRGKPEDIGGFDLMEDLASRPMFEGMKILRPERLEPKKVEPKKETQTINYEIRRKERAEKRQIEFEEKVKSDPVLRRRLEVNNIFQDSDLVDKILKVQNTDLMTLSERMSGNINYRPEESDVEIKFATDCHVKYGLMTEEERSWEFAREAAYWLGSNCEAWGKRSRALVVKGRKMADKCRAEYRSWCAAQYRRYFRKIMITHFCSKWAPKIFEEYIDGDYKEPEFQGCEVTEQYDLKRLERIANRKNYADYAREEALESQQLVAEWLEKEGIWNK
jgi:hypothetical protein